jgi:hypothetical protein
MFLASRSADGGADENASDTSSFKQLNIYGLLKQVSAHHRKFGPSEIPNA